MQNLTIILGFCTVKKEDKEGAGPKNGSKSVRDCTICASSQIQSDVHLLLCQSHNKTKALLPTYFLSNRLKFAYIYM